MSSPQTVSVLAHLANTVFTTIATLGAAWFLFAGTADGNRSHEIEILYRQQAVMRARLDDQAAQIIALRTENGLLKVQLNTQYKVSPLGVLDEFLNSIDAPAWCKSVDRSGEKIQFRMVAINPAYETFYSVTEPFYKGKTDFEVHGEILGQQYYQNDLEALVRKQFVQFDELVDLPTGTRGVRTFWKFWHQMPDETELICGMQLEI